MKQPVYDTGKVKIGKYYQRPPHTPTWDEWKIQGVLLGYRQPFSWRAIANKLLDKLNAFGERHA